MTNTKVEEKSKPELIFETRDSYATGSLFDHGNHVRVLYLKEEIRDQNYLKFALEAGQRDWHNNEEVYAPKYVIVLNTGRQFDGVHQYISFSEITIASQLKSEEFDHVTSEFNLNYDQIYLNQTAPDFVYGHLTTSEETPIKILHEALDTLRHKYIGDLKAEHTLEDFNKLAKNLILVEEFARFAKNAGNEIAEKASREERLAKALRADFENRM